MSILSSKKFSTILLIVLILLGIFFRVYHITEETFVYYDEGMWLEQGRALNLYAAQKQPGFLEFLSFNFKVSLPTGKALWQFIVNLRSFFFKTDAYAFARIVSAVCGIFTIGLLYVFSRRALGSRLYALLSAALLALLPSHVYYSRLGLQEALTAFLFLGGVYLYIYGRHFLLRTLFAGTLWAGVYFSSYRMIVLPLAVILLEFCFFRKFDVRRFVYSMLTFVSWIFILGSLNNGANILTTFGWMFHQSHLAGGTFDWMNLLSFPYYLAHFHNIFFAALFIMSFRFIQRKDWERAYPLILFILFGLMFSLSQEKGVRYITFLLPLAAFAVAGVVQQAMLKKRLSKILPVILATMFLHHIFSCGIIASSSTDYKSSMEALRARSSQHKILSTQAKVQSLFAAHPSQVQELRKGMPYLIAAYQAGFRFLVLDPQGYVSLTDSEKRFAPPLADYLQFVVKNIPPVQMYDHFSKAQLDWFVWEHNEDFRTSYQFLKQAEEEAYHELKVYDMNHIIFALKKVLGNNAI